MQTTEIDGRGGETDLRERPGKLQAPEGERQGEVEEIKKEKTKRLRYRTI